MRNGFKQAILKRVNLKKQQIRYEDTQMCSLK